MSKPLPWFRLYSEMVDDEKVRLLAFEDRWHFVAILCCKCAGLLDAGDPPELLRRKVGVKLGLAARELEAAANRLAEVGLIDAETFQPIAWDARQMRSDSSRERVAAFRARQKQARNVTETAQETDTEKEAEAEQGKAKAPRKRAAPVVDLPEWLDPEAWAAFVDHRRKIKAPMTDRAAELAVAELGKLRAAGHDPRAVIHQSILNGWRGLFAPKDSHDQAPAYRSARRESEAERVERINREHDDRERAAGGLL